MGLIYHDARRLWEARRSSVSFQTMLTIGRQQLFLHPSELNALRLAHQAEPQKASAPSPLADYRFGEYVERFFAEFLGATTMDSLDYSAYEGATITHDMNQPVPDSLRARYDAVIESGSLEHIFNFPVAVGNLMQMVKVGGTIFMTTVANNLCGHGFYQFSPELIYRIFSTENGFEPPRVVFLEADYPWVELTPIRKAYEVVDPASVGCRVGLLSTRPIMMMARAKKVREVQPFTTTPQQSDYTVAWDGKPASSSTPRPGLLRSIARKLPESWKRKLNGHRFNREYSLSNKRFYKELP